MKCSLIISPLVCLQCAVFFFFFLPPSVTQLMTAVLVEPRPDPMQYLHHLSALGLQGNTQREMQGEGDGERGEFCQRSPRTPCAAVLIC